MKLNYTNNKQQIQQVSTSKGRYVENQLQSMTMCMAKLTCPIENSRRHEKARPITATARI